MTEREEKILDACRHIGDTVYSVTFNVPNEEPRLLKSVIHHVHVAAFPPILLVDEWGSIIGSIEEIGRWNGDYFSSFSSSEVEEKIEEWWKEKLGL